MREVFVVVVGAPARTRRLRCAEFARWSEVWEGWSRWMAGGWKVDKRGNFAP